MKLVETSRGWILDEIRQSKNPMESDIRYKNLAGVESDPRYQPEHVIIVWVDDPEIRNVLVNELNFNVKEVERQLVDENGDVVGTTTRYSLKFKAYPKIKENPISGRKQTYPIVILNVGKNTRLEAESFKLVDSCSLETMAIRFHAYKNPYDASRPAVATIDEIRAVADSSAGVIDDSYLDEKYGGFDDDPDVDVPFE